MTEVVDTHVHVHPTRFATIETLDRAMKDAGCDRAVLVQSIGGDNDYLADAVRTAPKRFAAALWLDPGSANQEAELERLAASRTFRGIRLFAETLVTTPGTWLRAANLGLVILVSFLGTGLREVADELSKFAAVHPGAELVITRFGLPMGEPLASRPSGLLRDLAAFAAVNVELSPFPDRSTGLISEGATDAVQEAFDLFGPERSTFGSGFPARDRGGTVPHPEQAYRRDFCTLRTGMLGVPVASQPTVLSRTPHRIWFPGV